MADQREVKIILTFIAQQAEQAMAQAQRTFSNAMKGMQSGAGSAASVVGKATSSIGSAISKVASAVISPFKSMFKGFFDLGEQSRIAAVVVAGSMAMITKSILETTADFQRFGVAARFIAGTEEEGNKFINMVKEMAVVTNYSFSEMASQAQRVYANVNDIGKTKDVMMALSDAVAASYGGYSELDSVVRAWIQTNSKAVASSEELNRQFTNANIPAIKLLAERIVNDLDNPLRKYIKTSSNAGGASKALAKEYQKASEMTQDYGWKVQELSEKLTKQSDKYGENSWQAQKAASALSDYEGKYQSALGTIDQFNQASNRTVSSVGKANITMEEAMSALQNIGELKIPGQLVADELIKAMTKWEGAAEIMQSQTMAGQWERAKQMVDFLKVSFMGLDDELKPIEGSFSSLVTKGLNAFNDAMENSGDAIMGVSRAMGTNLSVQMGVLAMILGTIGAAIAALAGAWIIIGLKMAAIGAIIGWLIEKFIGMERLQQIFSDLGEKIPQAFDYIKGKAGPVLDWLSTKFDRVGQLATKFKDKVQNGLAQLLTGEQPTDDVMWRDLLKMMDDKYITPAKEKLQEFKDKYVYGTTEGDQKASWIDVLQKALDDLDRLVLTPVGEKIQWFKNLFRSEGQEGDVSWVQVITQIKDVVSSFINLIKDIASPVIEAWKDSFEEMGPVIQTWGELFRMAEPFLIQLLKVVVMLSLAFSTIMVGALVGVIGVITALIAGFAQILTGIVEVFTGIVQAVVGFFQMVVGYFTQNEQLMQEGWQRMTDGLMNIWEGFKSFFFDSAIDFVKTIINYFDELVEEVVGVKISTMVTGILTWLGALKDQGLAIINLFINAIKNAFTGMASDALNWGRDLINNMVEGIRQAIRSAGSFASTIAGNLGIDMNDVMFEHGGIVPGPVGKPVPIIAHAGERVVPRSGVDGGMGGTSPSINFYGTVNMDSQDRVEELARQIGRVLGRQNELASYGAGY